MNVPLLDLSYQHGPIKSELLAAIGDVVESNYFILGPAVQSFEDEVADYCNVDHAVGVSSGTDALLAALMALDVGPDDSVITTTFSFFATAGVIERLGARPIFVDIDPTTFNLSPDALQHTWQDLSQEERDNVRAIMPVHLFGQCADMDPILAFAAEHGIAVVEDAAQAIGAEYSSVTDGARQAGSMGIMGCFSFFPSKNLGGFGDGGMVMTSDDELAERLRILRVHGAKPKYHHHTVGGNFRLDAIQAAVLSVKLPYLDDWHRARRENAERYERFFHEAELVETVSLPASTFEQKNIEFPHIYNQYVIRVPRRDQLREFLTERGVSTAVYYPLPLHLQPCFAHLGYEQGALPASERAAQDVLALPIYPGITKEQQHYVVETIGEFYE